MRKILLALLFVVTSASAQTAPHSTPSSSTPVSGWQLVQALPPGSKIHIKFFAHHKTDCRVSSVDADSISCDTSAIFKRADIQSIRANHRVRSTLVGLGVGYGAAAAVTAVAARARGCQTVGCAGAIAVVDLGLLIAVPIIGHVTDFTAGTIYRAP
jgi:hypothetical protein